MNFLEECLHRTFLRLEVEALSLNRRERRRLCGNDGVSVLLSSARNRELGVGRIERSVDLVELPFQKCASSLGELSRTICVVNLVSLGHCIGHPCCVIRIAIGEPEV